MVQVDLVYEGDLHTRCTHGPSQAALETDAPVDNQGRGASYSPTDLVATALASCMLTTMAIRAEREGWRIDGARGRVEKHMVADPARRISRLVVQLEMPPGLDVRAREVLDQVARSCPVARSLSAGLEVELSFVWRDDEEAARA